MKLKLDQEEFVKWLSDNKPETLHDLHKMGLKTYKISSGLYRVVYKIKGFPYVVKITVNKGDIFHSNAEYKTVQKILKSKIKYKVLHKYMPFIAYYTKSTGMLVMEFYKMKNWQQSHAVVECLEDIVALIWDRDLAYGSENDLHAANIGFTKDGDPKIIDMGYFLPEGRGC